jgi:hypothetical protein
MKDRLRELKKNGLHRYKYLVFGRDSSYFEKKALILLQEERGVDCTDSYRSLDVFRIHS